LPYYFNPPPANPLTRLLAAVAAALALVGALFFGLFILAIAAGVGLIAWLVLALRMRWLQKNVRNGNVWSDTGDGLEPGGTVRPSEQKGTVIDAEYTVVSRRDEDS